MRSGGETIGEVIETPARLASALCANAEVMSAGTKNGKLLVIILVV